MKKVIICAMILCECIALQGQDFDEALQETYNAFEQDDSLQHKLNLINRFDLIAAKWPDQWVAHYYNAYAKIVTSYLLDDEKRRDALIDQAELSLTKAKQLLGKPTDELHVLEAYLANARLVVKPGSRWKKYGPIFDANLEEAKKMNADNPRIYFLKGQSLFYTPKAFGGGMKNALPLFEKAELLFGNDTSKKLDKPFWGHNRNMYYINECRK